MRGFKLHKTYRYKCTSCKNNNVKCQWNNKDITVFVLALCWNQKESVKLHWNKTVLNTGITSSFPLEYFSNKIHAAAKISFSTKE